MNDNVSNQALVNILCEIQQAKESLRENTKKLSAIIKKEYSMGNRLIINDMRAESPTDNLICLYDSKNVLHITSYENISDVVIIRKE